MNSNKKLLRKLISPSLMCGDTLNVEKLVHELEALNVDWIHIDIMDGHFVPNITFGIDVVNRIKVLTNIPLDVHLMVYEPEKYISRFNLTNEDAIAFHYEAVKSVEKTIDFILAKNVRPFLALKAETDINLIKPYLYKLDGILLMLTVPGSYGKDIEPGMMEKIGEANKIISENQRDVLIEVDGCVSFELAGKMSELGANVFVAGTSSIFNKAITISEGVVKLRGIVERRERVNK